MSDINRCTECNRTWPEGELPDCEFCRPYHEIIQATEEMWDDTGHPEDEVLVVYFSDDDEVLISTYTPFEWRLLMKLAGAEFPEAPHD